MRNLTSCFKCVKIIALSLLQIQGDISNCTKFHYETRCSIIANEEVLDTVEKCMKTAIGFLKYRCKNVNLHFARGADKGNIYTPGVILDVLLTPLMEKGIYRMCCSDMNFNLEALNVHCCTLC